MPICRAPTAAAFVALARLWSLVLVANLIGATIFAAAVAFSGMLTPPLVEGVVALGRHELEGGFGPTLAGGVGAGFLVAMMVWLIANLRAGDLAAVFLVTWLIGAAGFAHVVAGSVEMAVLVLLGHAGAGEVLAGYLLPALLGNMFGGTALFALIAYGQVMQELD